MSQTGRQLLLLCGVLILFIYVAATEVAGRLIEICNQYDDLRQKETELLDPLSFSRKKLALSVRRDSLTMFLTNDRGEFDKSQTGVIELLTRKAKTTGVHIESLRPMRMEREGQFENICFRISLNAGFHEIGVYINALESGHMAININKVELALRSNVRSEVHADVEGVAHTLPERSL